MDWFQLKRGMSNKACLSFSMWAGTTELLYIQRSCGERGRCLGIFPRLLGKAGGEFEVVDCRGMGDEGEAVRFIQR